VVRKCGHIQNEAGTGQDVFTSVVTSNWNEKLRGSVVEYLMLQGSVWSTGPVTLRSDPERTPPPPSGWPMKLIAN